MEISQLVGLAILCRALTQIFKRVYNKDTKVFHVPELISMGIGILVTCVLNVNMFIGMVPIPNQFFHWVFVVVTGVIFGQGGSFVYDLWAKLKTAGINVSEDKLSEIVGAVDTIKEIAGAKNLSEIPEDK